MGIDQIIENESSGKFNFQKSGNHYLLLEATDDKIKTISDPDGADSFWLVDDGSVCFYKGNNQIDSEIEGPMFQEQVEHRLSQFNDNKEEALLTEAACLLLKGKSLDVEFNF